MLGAGGQELVCSSWGISCEPGSPGGDANASLQLADILLHRLTHIKNLLPGRGAVLRQELGDGRRNRAWCHVLLMKFCCDASAADLNGGRFKTSHIRLSVSALICTVISTPISTRQKNQQLFLPDRPPSHPPAFFGVPCCRSERGAGCVADLSSSSGRGPLWPAQVVGRDLLLPPTAQVSPRGGAVGERSTARGVCPEPSSHQSSHPPVTNCDSIYYKPPHWSFFPCLITEGEFVARVGGFRSQTPPGVCRRSQQKIAPPPPSEDNNGEWVPKSLKLL